MKKINLLKKKILLLSILASSGLGILKNNTNVYAESSEIVEEDNNIVSNENFEPKTLDEYIEYYSNVYSIKKELIYDRLDYMINENNDNKDFLKMNEELKIITIARSIKNDRSISDDIKYTGNTYEVTLEPEELIEKYAPVIGTNKYIALSIAFSECVYPIRDDWNYNTNGNLAGIDTDMYLGNKEEGVIETLFIFRDDYNIKEDTTSDIFVSISQRYCPPNWSVWQSRATNYYNGLINNGYYSNSPEDIQKKHITEQKRLAYNKED